MTISEEKDSTCPDFDVNSKGKKARILNCPVFQDFQYVCTFISPVLTGSVPDYWKSYRLVSKKPKKQILREITFYE